MQSRTSDMGICLQPIPRELGVFATLPFARTTRERDLRSDISIHCGIWMTIGLLMVQTDNGLIPANRLSHDVEDSP